MHKTYVLQDARSGQLSEHNNFNPILFICRLFNKASSVTKTI
jgi:hypothetical protein